MPIFLVVKTFGSLWVLLGYGVVSVSGEMDRKGARFWWDWGLLMDMLIFNEKAWMTQYTPYNGWTVNVRGLEGALKCAENTRIIFGGVRKEERGRERKLEGPGSLLCPTLMRPKLEDKQRVTINSNVLDHLKETHCRAKSGKPIYKISRDTVTGQRISQNITASLYSQGKNYWEERLSVYTKSSQLNEVLVLIQLKGSKTLVILGKILLG